MKQIAAAGVVLVLSCGVRSSGDASPGSVEEGPAAVASPNRQSAEGSAPATAGPSAVGYAEAVAEISADRLRLRAALASASTDAERQRILAEARRTFHDAVTEALFPAWMGTPWAMNGMAERPGEEAVACGYFVATILRDAGFELHRVRFGQAAALRIQEATTPPGREVHRIFSIPPADLAKRIAGYGDGLYVIGLNIHVGFVHVHDGEVRFVHSSYTDDVVIDESLATSVAIANSQPAGYFVSELMSTDAAAERWLRGVEAKLPPA